MTPGTGACSVDGSARTQKTELHVVEAAQWGLVSVAGPAPGTRFPLGERTEIGRGADADLFIAHESLSRRHCVVTGGQDGTFVVRDLGSRNGTYVNGVRVAPDDAMVLRAGDKLRLGTEVVLSLAASDIVEGALLQRQRLEMVGRLTTGVVHDLNNMLGAVAAAADHLQCLPAGERAEDDAAECIDDIVAAAARAGDLASRLVAVARHRTSRATVSLRAVCEDAVGIASRTFGGGVRLASNLEGDPQVVGDATQLLQVVLNLLLNARDAVENAERQAIFIGLETELEEGQRWACVEVQDEGTGIPPSVVERIFDPFFSTKTSHVGCGVGLSVVREIVEAHGGSVAVTSIPGVGTSFRVRVPVVVAPTARRGHTTRWSLPRFGRYRVLLVDDEALFRRGLARVLRRQGHEVIECEGGRAAFEWLRTHEAPDLALLDLDMPDLDGFAVLRGLRRMGWSFPVVCVSGHHGEALREEDGRELPFLAKPFAAEHLYDAITAAVADSSARPSPGGS